LEKHKSTIGASLFSFVATYYFFVFLHIHGGRFDSLSVAMHPLSCHLYHFEVIASCGIESALSKPFVLAIIDRGTLLNRPFQKL
jgi:hypothetical protein